MGNLIDRKRRERAKTDRPARKTAILEAARKALLSQPTGELTLEALDRAAGLLQGSASVCCGSLEELVFRLLREETTAWLDQLEADAHRTSDGLRLATLANLLATSIIERPLFCRLLAALPTMADRRTVEMNQILEIETARLQRFKETGAFLESLCPDLKTGDGWLILRRTMLLAGALDQHVNPPSGFLLAMNDERLAPLFPDPGEELRSLLAAILEAASRAR